MIRLERTNGEVLSRILREVSPIRYESIRKVNKLLDGTYHVQIIGQPLMSIDASIISSHNQADELNELIDQGTPLVLIFLDRKYLVYIDEPIQWKRISFAHGNMDKSYFEGKVKMLIKEEITL